MKRGLLEVEFECFARAYHYRSNLSRVFNDEVAGRLLGDRYDELEKMITDEFAICLGLPDGSGEKRLERIMKIVSTCGLVSDAFCEDALVNAARLGCRQYINIGAGYDTYSCRCDIEDMRIIEADVPEVVEAKSKALAACGENTTRASYFMISENMQTTAGLIGKFEINRKAPAFVSIMNISAELSRAELYILLRSISSVVSSGSSVVLRYNSREINRIYDENSKESPRFMPDYNEMETLLSKCGLRIYELLKGREAERRFLYRHNMLEWENEMCLPENVCYCLAVKK